MNSATLYWILNMTITEQIRLHCAGKPLLVACEQIVREAFPAISNGSGKRDVDALARQAGIVVKVVRSSEFEGKFESEDNTDTISLSASSISQRRRFTLAHELGHYILRRFLKCDLGGEAYRRREPPSDGFREEEVVANQFAAEILMPARAVFAVSDRRASTFALAREVCATFDVSRIAAIRRIVDVARRECVLVSLIPSRFSNEESRARVDRSVWMKPHERIRFDREGTRMIRHYSFSHIKNHSLRTIGFVGQFGRHCAEYDCVYSRHPIPNVDVLMTLDHRSCGGAYQIGRTP
jgi:hypothetical protein